jgi:hypothetical protein
MDSANDSRVNMVVSFPIVALSTESGSVACAMGRDSTHGDSTAL